MEAVKRVRQDQVSNGAEEAIVVGGPYRVGVELSGTSDMLFHRWNAEGVEALPRDEVRKACVRFRRDAARSARVWPGMAWLGVVWYGWAWQCASP